MRNEIKDLALFKDAQDALLELMKASKEAISPFYSVMSYYNLSDWDTELFWSDSFENTRKDFFYGDKPGMYLAFFIPPDKGTCFFYCPRVTQAVIEFSKKLEKLYGYKNESFYKDISVASHHESQFEHLLKFCLSFNSDDVKFLSMIYDFIDENEKVPETFEIDRYDAQLEITYENEEEVFNIWNDSFEEEKN